MNLAQHPKRGILKDVDNMTECQHCGEKFDNPTGRKKYCSDRCKEAAQRERKRSRESVMPEVSRAARPDAEQAIIDVNTEAIRAGMTYGQYVAQKYCQGLGTRHFERGQER